MNLSAEVSPKPLVGDPEVKAAQTLVTENTSQPSLADRVSNFSSWSRATKAKTRILRWIKKDKSDHLTTVTEQNKAECVIVKAIQNETYKDEMDQISQKKNLSQNDELDTLDPFMGKDGLLKVGGRLGNSSLPYSLKHPTVLPKSPPKTKMIIADCHERKGFTMNEMRERGFWIPNMRKVVASCIQGCFICRKHRRPV